jgi:hypothetical protein
MPKLTLVPKLDAKEKPIQGRFIARLVAKVYTPRVLRGAIELPSERTIRTQAEAKRARRRERNRQLAGV